MLSTIISITCLLAQAVTQAIAQDPDSGLMFKIFIPTASVSSVMYMVWYYTFRQSKKDYTTALKQNQEQFQFALKQNEDQFGRALTVIENQHKENLSESRRINDRLFEVIQKDGEYKEILTGVLTEMKKEIFNHNANHNGKG